MRSLTFTAYTLFLSLAVGACSGVVLSPETTIDNDKPTQASFARFPDLPMPVKAELNMFRTLVFGTNDSWIGRLVISASHSPNDMFDFYKQEMTGFDWQEITSVRSDTSVMTYVRDGRVATIQISGATLSGAMVIITVSPKGAEEFPPPPISNVPPAR
jgi:hypothetical protein